VIAADHRRVADLLAAISGAGGVQMFGERAHVHLEPNADVSPESIAQHLSAAGLTVHSVRAVSASLEDVFIARLKEVGR
jgi:hypothetical protein